MICPRYGKPSWTSLLDVHADAYADCMNEEFVQRFPWFVDHWGGNPGFTWRSRGREMCRSGSPAGLCRRGRQWWQGHLDTQPADPATFHVSELMVRPRWRKTGDSLLEGRGEASAVLTVDTKRPRLQAMDEGGATGRSARTSPSPTRRCMR